MRKIGVFILCSYMFLCGAGKVFALAQVPNHSELVKGAVQGEGPVALIRYLENLHDAIALNKRHAGQQLSDALATVGEEMLTFPPSVWENSENLYALITYLFIGGDPKIVQVLLKNVKKSSVSRPVIRGALAYAYHDTEKFLKIFSKDFNDFKKLPIDLQLAIYLGTASEDALDTKLALQRLDYVRVIAPGSLLEEAALRREVRLAEHAEDVCLIKRLARNYIARFSHSPYQKFFWQNFGLAMVNLAPRLTDAQIGDFLEDAPHDLCYMIYLHISRAALISGDLPRAHYAAQRAIEIASQESYKCDTAYFYYAASSIGTTDVFTAIQILRHLNPDHLSSRDRGLFAACFKIADEIIKNKTVFPPLGQRKDNTLMAQAKEYFEKERSRKDVLLLSKNHALANEDLTLQQGSQDQTENVRKEGKNKLIFKPLPIPETSYITDIEIEHENNKVKDFLKEAQKILDSAQKI